MSPLKYVLLYIPRKKDTIMRTNSEIRSSAQGDSSQHGINSECQDRRPMSSDERTRLYTRNLISVPNDTSNISNADHPMPASTLEQQRDENHPQPESQQRRRNILSRMWRCLTLPCRRFNNFVDDLYSDPVYQYLWDPNPPIERIAERNDQDSLENGDKIQKLIGKKLHGLTNGKWKDFGNYLLDKYDENLYEADGPRENKNTRLLFDVLKGGEIKYSQGRLIADQHVKDPERNGDDYKELTNLVRDEWPMYNAKLLLKIDDLSEVRPDSWLQFSHDLLEKHTEEHINPKYLKDILQGYTADIETNTADFVSIEERKKPEYRKLIGLVQNEWENWTRKKAGELLDRDLSKVRPEIWTKFSEDVLSTYKDKDEDNYMLLKDILKGGVLCIKDTVRESDVYKNLISDVCDKWDKPVDQ